MKARSLLWLVLLLASTSCGAGAEQVFLDVQARDAAPETADADTGDGEDAPDGGAEDLWVCEPNCADRECGWDGCGGTCGSCGEAGSCVMGSFCRPKAVWTVLVYMVADNDLEPFSFLDLEEMMNASTATGLNIVVQADWVDGMEYRTPDSWKDQDYATTQRLLIEPGGYRLLEDLGERNMASSEVLSDFVFFGLTQFPAERYALVFWDHGGGIAGFGWDQTSGYASMLPSKLAYSVGMGLQQAGFGDRKLDLVGFDACLMANFETVALLAPYADHFVASEETEPGYGWDFKAFTDAPDLDPEGLGEQIIADYMEQFASNPWGGFCSLALMDLGAFPAVADSWKQLIGAVSGKFDDNVGAFAAAVGKAQSFGMTSTPYAVFTGLLDMGNMAEIMADSSFALAGKAGAFLAALDELVVVESHGEFLPGARGLCIYMPVEEEDMDWYTLLDSSPPEYWVEFIERWYGWLGESFDGNLFSGGDWVNLTQDADGVRGTTALRADTLRYVDTLGFSVSVQGDWEDTIYRSTELVQIPEDPSLVQVGTDYMLYSMQNGSKILPVHAVILQRTPTLELEVPLALREGKRVREISWRLSFSGPVENGPDSQWYELPGTRAVVPPCTGTCEVSPILESETWYESYRGPGTEYLPAGDGNVLLAQKAGACTKLGYRLLAKTLWGASDQLNSGICTGRFDDRFELNVTVVSSGPWKAEGLPSWTMRVAGPDGASAQTDPAPPSDTAELSLELSYGQGQAFTLSLFDAGGAQPVFALEGYKGVSDLLQLASRNCSAVWKKSVTKGEATATINMEIRHCLQ